MLLIEKVNKYLEINIKLYEVKELHLDNLENLVKHINDSYFKDKCSILVINLIKGILLLEIQKKQKSDPNLQDKIDNTFLRENRREVYDIIKEKYGFTMPPMFSSNLSYRINLLFILISYLVFFILIRSEIGILFVIPFQLIMILPLIIGISIGVTINYIYLPNNDPVEFVGIKNLNDLAEEIKNLNSKKCLEIDYFNSVLYNFLSDLIHP